jgi:adenylate kinase
VIVMMGAPGAGKGTQAARLAEALGLPHVSTGELFRSMLAEDSRTARRIRRYMDSGRLVPDDIVVDMVRERLAQDDAAAGVILDGFPRTVAQAEALDEMLRQAGAAVTAVPYLEVPQELIVARLSGRRVCTVDDQHVYHVQDLPPRKDGLCDVDGAPLIQRGDDSETTVLDRLAKQLPPMYEVVDHYADQEVLFPVRGDQPPDEVTAVLLRIVGARDLA